MQCFSVSLSHHRHRKRVQRASGGIRVYPVELPEECASRRADLPRCLPELQTGKHCLEWRCHYSLYRGDVRHSPGRGSRIRWKYLHRRGERFSIPDPVRRELHAMKSEILAVVLALLVAGSLGAGYFAGSLNTRTTTITTTNIQTATASNSVCVVSFANEQVNSGDCSCMRSDSTESCSVDLVNVGNTSANPSGECALAWGGDDYQGTYSPVSSIMPGSSEVGACMVAANGIELPGSGTSITGLVNLMGSSPLLFRAIRS